MTALAFRPATEADRDWLWAVKCAGLRPYVEQTFGAWNESVQRERFDASFAAEEIQVIAHDGREVGYTAVRVVPDTLHLLNVMIAAEFQGRGLGTEILRRLQAEATATRRPIQLQVLKVNPAYRLYRRLGFTLTEETPTHYRMQWLPSEGGGGEATNGFRQ